MRITDYSVTRILMGILFATLICGSTLAEGKNIAQPNSGNEVEAIQLAQVRRPEARWTTRSSNSQAIIEKGTNRFVSPDRQKSTDSLIKFEGSNVQLNFLNTDIREFARSVLVDILRVDYVIDPKLEGAVTVRTNKPVPREQAFAILSEVLRMNGARLSKKNKIIHISRAAKSNNGLQIDLGKTARIIPLNFVGPAQAAQSLSAFSGPAVRIQPNAAGRFLLLFGSTLDLDKLENIISIFDVNQMKGLSFGLFRLQVASPSAVAAELSKLFEKVIKSDPEAVKFIPFSRMNGLLVIASNLAYLNTARTWIARLDQAQSDESRIYVYEVQNRRAEDLATVLAGLFGNKINQAKNSVTELAPGLTEQNYQIQADNIDTGNRQSSAQKRSGNFGGPAFDQTAQQNINIIADKTTNSLLINATPREYSAVLSALVRIDTVPLQVMIEATIVEVTLNDELEYGVRWFFENGRGKTSLTDNAAGVVSETFPGFNYFFNAPKLKLVVSALEEVTDVEIVSSPSITVLDNETAKLVVGDQVPISTRSAVGITDPSAPVVNDIEFRDTGIILSVTPRVNSSGLVTLDISQEVSDVVETTTSSINSPTISQRKIKSSVAVHNGRAIILGGLMSRKRIRGKAGVPFLQRIPKLGAIFRNSRRSGEKTELLVVIKPSVIRNQDDADAIGRELSEKFSDIFALQPLAPQDYKN